MSNSYIMLLFHKKKTVFSHRFPENFIFEPLCLCYFFFVTFCPLCPTYFFQLCSRYFFQLCPKYFFAPLVLPLTNVPVLDTFSQAEVQNTKKNFTITKCWCRLISDVEERLKFHVNSWLFYLQFKSVSSCCLKLSW